MKLPFAGSIKNGSVARLPVAFDVVIDAMALDSEWDILGLYWGHPVGNPGGDYTGALPPTIFLYRRPLLDEWAHGEDTLERVVAHVLVHEVGHHFGLSDDDIHAIEDKD